MSFPKAQMSFPMIQINFPMIQINFPRTIKQFRYTINEFLKDSLKYVSKCVRLEVLERPFLRQGTSDACFVRELCLCIKRCVCTA